MVRFARRLAARLGFDMIWRDYYSPIPDLADIPDEVWDVRSDLVGLDLPDVDRQLEYVAAQLAPFIREFSPPPGFRLDNGSYGPVDAELLHAIVRAHKPAHVLEVGAGFSTFVTAAACDANARDGAPARLVAVDPYPPGFLKPGLPGLSEVRTEKATDIPFRAFAELGSGDILFLDTTHTVKLGGDVTYLLLEVLPRLAPGVIVHVHDIFLPWHYPRRWFEEEGYYWAEQYLLQAFLAFNADFDVLVGCHMLARERPGELARMVPSFTAGAAPAALWLQRRGADRIPGEGRADPPAK